MLSRPTIALGEAPLSLDDVTAIAHRRAGVELSPEGRAAVLRARAVVDRLVDQGIPAYGITTGVGSQKDFGVNREAIARYNTLMITAHATIAPGPNASAEVIRAALAIQLALFAKGRSGVRLELVESLLARLQADDLPAARSGSSVGASDIVAMSQLAVPLIGKQGVAPGGSGPAPLDGLAAKEAISLLNSNSLMLAEATLALAEVRALLNAATLAGALSMEGFRGNLRSWREEVDLARGQPGQIRSGRALREALAGSRLWQTGEARFLQDPLSFRCIPQIHGAAEAAYDFAHAIFEAELSAACDNPLIDAATGAFLSHGNMETSACCLAMDTLRQALAKLIEASGQRIHKIQWPGFTGLPTSLAVEPGAIGGVQFLNLGHLAGANVGAVRQAAFPALLNYSGQLDDGVEDVAGNAPQSVAETVRSLVPAWNVVTLEVACAVWAVHRRDVPLEALGKGLQPLAREILALLPIGREGEAIFDLGPLVEVVKAAAGLPAGEK
ncbi:histidine ammonia-lyase [Labrys miyagiensis]|uniref:Histidine ammonia-lyase n=1 Tax=Labrys miyagiensis TaxID=346912 RepID=A0ABQ6CHA3_9HYPH|nr:aromatic amino acid lyase [Labrys miyagiensis]GLS19728.1 histidine ammonia-lyase [Labrys miyagiensis]